MPSTTCESADPVELLLRNILRRASLLAGVTSLAACASSVGLDARDPDIRAQGTPDAHVRPTVDTTPEAATSLPDDPFLMRPAAVPTPEPGTDISQAAGVDDLDPNASPRPEPLGRIPCDRSNYPPISVAGLKPAEDYEYVALRRRIAPEITAVVAPLFDTQDAGSDEWTYPEFETLSETGRPCASATQPACAQSIANHPIQYIGTHCSRLCFEESIVTTRNDEVKRWVGLKQTKLLLGPIDTPEDALLLVRVAGFDIICDDPSWTSPRPADDGYEVLVARLRQECGVCRTNYHLHVSRSAEITTLSEEVVNAGCACGGRMPAGLRSTARARGESLLGDFLAACAHLEAASVISFERLERELMAHGAPCALTEAARSARADEVRHAAIVGQLARARGGEPVEPVVEPLAVRALEEIALENVVEGCVRETYAALIASYQAEHARDSELRAAMNGIAEDELRHAILAHRVQRWIIEQLDLPARTRVMRAKQRAVGELVREAAQPVPEQLQRAAGLPSAAVAGGLVGELVHSLWAEPAPAGSDVAEAARNA